MPKPTAIDANTLLASKGKPTAAVTNALQRGQVTSDLLVDLNFKVPAEFRQRFKRCALESNLKGVQLLQQALSAWERDR